MDDIVDEMMAEPLNVDYDSEEGSRAPCPQVGERSPAAGNRHGLRRKAYLTQAVERQRSATLDWHTSSPEIRRRVPKFGQSKF